MAAGETFRSTRPGTGLFKRVDGGGGSRTREPFQANDLRVLSDKRLLSALSVWWKAAA